MLARMPSRLFSEWMAYYQIEPFGEQRADLRSGIVASVIANVFRGKSRRQHRPADFLPRFDQDPKPAQSTAMQKALWRRFFAACNRMKKRHGNHRQA